MNLAEEKRRIHVGEMHLSRAVEIALGTLEILGHHAEVDIFRAENMTDLAQRFLHANVAAGIARAVVAGKEQLELFAGRPALADAELPREAAQLDHGAHPRDEQEIGHAPAPVALTTALAAASAGQGFAGYLKLLARLNCSSG